MDIVSRSLLCLAIAGACALPAAAQQVYSWKDAKGVTHYSDAPPPKGAAKAREIKTDAPPPPPAATTATPVEKKDGESADAAAKRDPSKPKPAEPDPQVAAAARATNCKNAQDNLTMLQGYAPVGVDADGDGKTDKVFNAEERQAQQKTMQDAVASNCKP